MPFHTDRGPRASFARSFAALLFIGTLAAALFAGAASAKGNANRGGLLLETAVSADNGGVFSAGPGVSVTIPAGALSKNASLTVRAIGAQGELSSTQTAASG